MNVVSRSLEVLRHHGPATFVARSIGFVYRHTLRPILPKTHFRTDNEVKVERIPSLDLYLSSVFPAVWDRKPDREQGLVGAHEKLTREGDSVVIVGGGNAITTVRAADIVGDPGHVRVYEGGREAVENIHDVASWNGVADRCEITHAIVGEERDVYGGAVTDADLISPGELPACDVLELDCEGSEIDIIGHLEIEPRVLLVELHPYNFPESPDEVMAVLSEKGYRVDYYAGHDGEPLSRVEFETLLSHSNTMGDELADRPVDSNRGQELVGSGARWPVVFAAVRTSDGSP